MVKPKCACGCGRRAANRHHVIYAQALRAVAHLERDKVERRRVSERLATDKRNLLWLAFDCHQSHHGRSKVLPLVVLPDSVFEFAAETLGAGAAYEYIRRRYRGTDARLDALLELAS